MGHSFCILTTIALLLVPLAAGAPEVGLVSGTVQDGQTVTVTGSGFGMNGPDVRLFDDFETGPDGASISLTGPDIGSWTTSKNPAKERYTGADKISGRYSAQFIFDSLGGAEYGNLQRYDNEGYTELFLSAWVKVPAGQFFPGSPTQNNWKLFWVDGTGNWGGPSNDLVLINSYSFDGDATTFGNSGSINGFWWDSTEPHIEQDIWTRYSFWVKGDPTSGSFHAWVLRNGTPLFQNEERNSLKTMNAGQPDWHYLSLNAWALANQGSPSRPLYDDIYFAVGPHARARIELGDRPSYQQCTNLAVQTPSSWGDTSVQVTVRQGQFKQGDNVYLFVIDEQGSNSNGYPVTISGASGGCGDGVCIEDCTTCPSDCGICAPRCGDAVCNGTETCTTCPADCTSNTEADLGPCDGCISITELNTYISDWKSSSSITIEQLIAAIAAWKGGCP
jgi:hypothetical protein